MPTYICIDTNIPLLDATNIVSLGAAGDIVVIPETVIDELDNKKSGLGELAYQARAFGRLIAAATHLGRVQQEDLIISKFSVEGSEVWIVSSLQYPDLSDVASNILNDRKIIEIAFQLKSANIGDVTFMSNDVMARIRAESIGVETTDFKVVDTIDYEFIKDYEVESTTFKTLHNTHISDIDPNYLTENYSYKFTTTDSAQVKLATIDNGIINILGKDTEHDLRKQMAAPGNAEQLLLAKAMNDPAIDLILLEGPAGTGKNTCTLSGAIKLMKLNKAKYTSIVYIRTPQNDEQPGEDIGYLSGNDEKLEMYLGPLQDTVDFLIRSNMETKGAKREDIEIKVAERTEKLVTDCSIEARISTGVRGRTFHNSIIILDEMQNASSATMQKLLTRIGKDCKVVVMGSNRQIDNKYLTKFNNGLTILLNESRERKVTTDIRMFAIELKSVLRSSMALFAEQLFTGE